jgi:pimeloyl-ACP methyl ester carboxylesterase
MRPHRLLLALAVSAVYGSSAYGSTVSHPPGPQGNLYKPPHPLLQRPAGTLIWAQRVPLPLNPPATVWRILYHSRNVKNKDIAVSGFAVIPTAAARGRRAVYAWAHGSVGQADRCAPSRDIRSNLPPYGGQLVAAGVALVATDYEGLGTPGSPTPYVGISEGQAILDSVRVMKQLPGVGKLGPVVVAGHSQGGGAALWAAQLAHSYAPALDVRGVVSLAPAAEFATIVKSLRMPPFSGYLGEALWAVEGLRAAYARSDLVRLLTRAARADLPRVAHECAGQTIARWRGKAFTAVFARDPFSVPSFVKLLDQISPGHSNPKVPILLAQGDQDEQIPVTVSARLLARYCRLGATVTRRVYPGVNHEGVLDAATNDVLAWIRDRFAKRPAPSSC